MGEEMRRLLRIVPVALIALAIGSGAALAQSTDTNAPSDGAADQLKSGAQRIGEGAEKIGEGIKQGAIQAWGAVKAGANAAGDKLNGSGSSQPKTQPLPPPAPAAPATPDSN